MNRHSPLFRVAFLSLLMALGLPLLVFTAAHVRQRQLQSKANPRWAKFAEINGGKTVDRRNSRDAAESKSSTVGEVESNRSPIKRVNPRVEPLAPQTSSTTHRNEQRSIDFERPQLERPPIERAAKGTPDELSSAERSGPPSLNRSQTRPNRTLPDRQLPDAEIANSLARPHRIAPVPEPEDELEKSKPRPPTVVTSLQPFAFLRPAVEADPSMESTPRLEARLAGLQRRIDQLAQAQADQKISELDRTVNMLQKTQLAKQAPQSQVVVHQDENPFESPQPATNLPPLPNAPRPAPPVPAVQVPLAPTAPIQATEFEQSSSQPGTTQETKRENKGREPSIKITQENHRDDEERFSIQVQDANLTEVLEMLGQLSGVNILTSRDVQGRITLNLQDVTVDRTLEAIAKSQGFVYERERDFIYVRTAIEDLAMKQSNRKLVSKIYQLHHINANEVQKLLDPVLTKGVGRHAVTSPSQTGIAQSASSTGGDGLSQRDTLVVQDYPDVIAEVDRIIIEVDVPPLQVMIEAKILSVALSDSLKFGINFAMLNGRKSSQVLTAAGDPVTNSTGLKCGYIVGDIATFIEALQGVADTSLVASPNLRVLNKQRAEMLIGNRVGYKSLTFNGSQTVENIQFLDGGVKLLLRPFISPDGLVRLEVHPERSKASLNARTGLPEQVMTEVTTNVMVRDGTTVVIGGLISEQVVESVDRVPIVGSIPLVGAAFRHRSEQTVRTELIVLLTPHIVTEPDACIDAEKLQFETEERAAYFRDHMSPLNRTSSTRAHYERAVECFEQGNLLKARQQIDAALKQNKGDIECQRLKLRIDKALRDQQSKVWKWPMLSQRTTTPN